MLTLYSAANHTGLLAGSDSLLAFAPVAQIVDNARLNTLLDTFDQSVQNGLMNNVTQLQAKFLRQWFAGDSIGSLELILRTQGFLKPAANKSYVTLIGVLLVRIRLPLLCPPLTGREASAKQRECSQSRFIWYCLHVFTTKFSISARMTPSHRLQSTPTTMPRSSVSRLAEWYLGTS